MIHNQQNPFDMSFPSSLKIRYAKPIPIACFFASAIELHKIGVIQYPFDVLTTNLHLIAFILQVISGK